MADANVPVKRSDAAFSASQTFFPIVILLGGLALVPWVATAIGDPFLIRVCIRVIIFSIAAVALNLVLGFGGLISLMHAGLFGIGAYTVAIMAYHDYAAEPLMGLTGTSELLISIPICLIVAAAASAMFGCIALRTTGTYFIMITLAFNQMLYYFFVGFQKYGGEDGLQVLSSMTIAGFDSTRRIPFYYVCLFVLGCVLMFVIRLIDSRFGLVLRAMSQNERRVIALGLPSLRYKLAAFVISGALAGLAGGLWTNSQQFVSPADMSWVRSGDLILIAVLGGTMYVWGPVVGAAAYLILELVLSSWTTYWQLPFGIFIVGTVVFFHHGLVDAGRNLVRRFFGIPHG